MAVNDDDGVVTDLTGFDKKNHPKCPDLLWFRVIIKNRPHPSRAINAPAGSPQQYDHALMIAASPKGHDALGNDDLGYDALGHNALGHDASGQIDFDIDAPIMR